MPLKYGNKNLDPRCFQALTAVGDSVDLSQCNNLSHDREGEEKTKIVWDSLASFDRFNDGESDPYGYLAYSFIGKIHDDLYIFERAEASGGTGNERFLYVCRLVNNILTLQYIIAGGDRDDGSVVFDKSHVKDNQIFYSVNVTPSGLLKLTGSGFDVSSLPDCFICGIGMVNYSYDVMKKQSMILSIELDLGYTFFDSSPDTVCFKKVYDKWRDGVLDLNRKTITLSAQQLEKFTSLVQSKCQFKK